MSFSVSLKSHATDLLYEMIGANHQFRSEQWEAVEAIVVKRQRVLVVQRTSWGKSLVYFLATWLLLSCAIFIEEMGSAFVYYPLSE